MKVNSTKLLTAVALILLAAVAVSQTITRTHMHGDHMMGGHMLGFYTKALNLTDAQQAQVKDIIAKEKPTVEPLYKQMSQSRNDIEQLLQSSGFDEAKVRAMAAQQALSIQELIVQRARIESEVMQVLTPDQKTKMAQMMQKHQERFMKHMQEPAPDAPNQ